MYKNIHLFVFWFYYDVYILIIEKKLFVLLWCNIFWENNFWLVKMLNIFKSILIFLLNNTLVVYLQRISIQGLFLFQVDAVGGFKFSVGTVFYVCIQQYHILLLCYYQCNKFKITLFRNIQLPLFDHFRNSSLNLKEINPSFVLQNHVGSFQKRKIKSKISI